MKSAENWQHDYRGEDLNQSFYPGTAIISGQEILTVRDDFVVEGLDKKLRGARETFFLNQEVAITLGLDKYLLQSSRFHLREDWAIGRTDSALGVFFGELVLTIDNGQEIILPVACKPYPLFERHRAVHEYVALRHFRSNPSLPSFDPIGFWLDARGKATLLTVFEEPVMSLDNVEWDKPGQMALGQDDELALALKKSARTLGSLHINGYAHRDAQIKNMAVDKRNWAMRLIDLTRLSRIHEPEDPRPIEWQKAVYDDLNTLIGSLRRAGYIEARPRQGSLRIINLGFLALHASMINHPSATNKLFPGAGEIAAEIHADLRQKINKG